MRHVFTVFLCTLGSVGCGSSVTVHQDRGPSETEPAPVPEPDPTAACPSDPGPPPPDAVACVGQVPEGTVDEDGAEAIFARAVHEADHILFALEDIDGSFDDTTDDGFMVGALVRPPAGSPCAVVRFVCWTGGHGGFGPTGLHGQATLVFEDGGVEMAGRLGLVESGALQGAPYADVQATIDGVDVAGTVDDFEL